MKMKKNKICYFVGIMLLIGAAVILISNYSNKSIINSDFKLAVNLLVKSDAPQEIKLYFKESDEDTFNEDQTQSQTANPGKKESLTFNLPYNANILRLDLGGETGDFEIYNINVKEGVSSASYDLNLLLSTESRSDYITTVIETNNSLNVITKGEDPYFLLGDVRDLVYEVKHDLLNQIYRIALPSGAFILFVIILISILKSIGYSYLKEFIKDIVTSRALILKLAKNDFNARYKGSFFGIAWAVISPLLTVLIYWFVFQVGFKSSNIEDIPFILWFIPGIIPWFYFSEALGVVTSCFLEYSYLVKKMVFKISILPIVKLLSLITINLLFVVLAFIFYFAYGNSFHLHNFQIFYYYFCLLFLSFGITLFTSTVMVFFKDMSQVIGIVLQFGFWLTPIVWNMNILSPTLTKFFKLNPMIYIVDGFRDTFIYKQWFFDKPLYTLYFWCVSILILFGGMIVFKKLKPHFSDVL